MKKIIILFMSLWICFAIGYAAPKAGRVTDFHGNVAASSQVNINSADAKALATLKGIGEKKAMNIVEYRKNHGNFKSIDDLEAVKGINKKIIAYNKDRLTL